MAVKGQTRPKCTTLALDYCTTGLADCPACGKVSSLLSLPGFLHRYVACQSCGACGKSKDISPDDPDSLLHTPEYTLLEWFRKQANRLSSGKFGIAHERILAAVGFSRESLQGGEFLLGGCDFEDLKEAVDIFKPERHGRSLNWVGNVDDAFLVTPVWGSYGRPIGIHHWNLRMDPACIGSMSMRNVFAGHIPRWNAEELYIAESYWDMMLLQSQHLHLHKDPLPIVIPIKGSRGILNIGNFCRPAKLKILSYDLSWALNIAERCETLCSVSMLSQRSDVSVRRGKTWHLALHLEELEKRLEPFSEHRQRLRMSGHMIPALPDKGVLAYEGNTLFLFEGRKKTPVLRGTMLMHRTPSDIIFKFKRGDVIHFNKTESPADLPRILRAGGIELLAFFKGRDILDALTEIEPALRRRFDEEEEEARSADRRRNHPAQAAPQD